MPRTGRFPASLTHTHDRKIAENQKALGHEKQEEAETAKTWLISTYKRAMRLTYLERCGLCGTTRHTTKPYWNIGMRLCKCCLQDNLVSQPVLEERYWLHTFLPIHVKDGKNFSQLVAGKVWCFKEHCGPRQRAEFSADAIDHHPAFGKSPRDTWFFWRPHLNKVLDMSLVEQEARQKDAAAHTIRAFARRSLTMRTLGAKSASTLKGRLSRPTYPVVWQGRSQAIRFALHILRRMGTPGDTLARSFPRWNSACLHRIADNEDRLE